MKLATLFIIIVTLMLSACFSTETDVPTYEERMANLNPLDSGVVMQDSLLDERDGRVYKTIHIGDQHWMAENLAWRGRGAWFDYDSLANKEWGRFYIWEHAKEACPDGWVLPSIDDWEELFDEVAVLFELDADKNNNWLGVGRILRDTSTATLDGGQRGLDLVGFNAFMTGIGGGGGWWEEHTITSYWSSSLNVSKVFSIELYSLTDENSHRNVDEVIVWKHDYEDGAREDYYNLFNIRCLEGKS